MKLLDKNQNRGVLHSIFIAVAFLPSAARAQLVISKINHHRIDEIVSVFENSTETLQYDYVENLNDGRGYTAGRTGATTATGDVLDIVKEYLDEKPDSAFTSILPTLKTRARERSGSVVGLESFPSLWRNAANDPVFRDVQDDVADWMWFQPALKIANKWKIQSALGMLCFYDTIFQQGEIGNDGLDYVLKNMKHGQTSETDFLIDFLIYRRYVLLHPHDPSTADAWAESIGRVDTLQKLVKSGNFNLNGPFVIKPYDQAFIIQ